MDATINSAHQPIGIIVLAAGASRRMKEPKQLLQFEGKTLLRRAIETAVESIYKPVIVVLGANFGKMRVEIEDLPVEIAFNKDWRSGLSSSIKAGLADLLRIAPNIAAVMMTLADQPLVTANQINLFAENFYRSDQLIIAAEYNETHGVPALFSSAVFADFSQLSGDQGAKMLMKKHRARLTSINLPEAAFDIDTPRDFAGLKH